MTSIYEFTRDVPITGAIIANFLSASHKAVAALLADGEGASFCYSAEMRQEGLRIQVRSTVPPKGGDFGETPSFSDGETVAIRSESRFEKRVNGRGEKPNRMYALDDDDARQKFADFLSSGGFEVVHLSLSEPSFVGMSKGIHGYSRNVTALVRVVDADRARDAVATGFGRGKSYGFGFIHVAR